MITLLSAPEDMRKIPMQPHLCQLVEALHMPFLPLDVVLQCKAAVTVHDERHMFGHGSSLGDTIQEIQERFCTESYIDASGNYCDDGPVIFRYFLKKNKIFSDSSFKNVTISLSSYDKTLIIFLMGFILDLGKKQL